MFKEEHPHRTVSSQVLCNMVESMPDRMQEVVGNTSHFWYICVPLMFF
jgi:hypothetical protein